MNTQPIPSPAVRRLSLYLRHLEQLAAEGVKSVASNELAESLNVTAAQVRKDLGYFGQFGRPGVGYGVGVLIEELRRILGTDRVVNVILVGAGDLGRALLRYKGFRRKGFNLVAAFDVAPGKIGRAVGTVNVHHIDELRGIVRKHKVKLAVLAVPVEVAQETADLLAAAGIRGIMNFAPATLHTDSDLAVSPVDLAAHLEELSFRIGHHL